MRARWRNLHAQNAQIDTLFPIQEPSRLFKSRPTSRVVRFTSKRGASLSLPSTLHPRILLSLRRNQFGISVNRPLSSPRNTASRDSPLNRDPITLPMRDEFLHGWKDIYSLLLFLPFRRSYATRRHCYLERKEGGGAKIPIISRINRIMRGYLSPCTLGSFHLIFSSRSFVREQRGRNGRNRETPEASHR